jgi:hypothetical protein
MEARALVLGLSTKRMCETPNACANTAYARPLPAATAPRVRTVPGLRLARRAARRLAGMVPGTATATATAMANVLMVMAIRTARRVRRSTAVTTPQTRAIHVGCLACCTAVRVAGLAPTANLLTTTTIRAASGGRQRLRRRRRRRPTRTVAGGLGGGHQHRRMLSELGAPMHFALRVKQTCVVARAAVSSNVHYANFYLPVLINLFRLIFFGLFRFKMCSVFGLQNLLKSCIVPVFA